MLLSFLSRIVAVAVAVAAAVPESCRVAELQSRPVAEVVAVRPGHAVRQTLQVAFPVAMAYT